MSLYSYDLLRCDKDDQICRYIVQCIRGNNFSYHRSWLYLENFESVIVP